MIHYLENLPVTEAEKIKKTIMALFKQTCILQEKYDPVTLVPSDNEQYEICMKHRGFIEQYLAITDCELEYYAQEHIFRLVGEGAEAVAMSKMTTILVLLIKLIYREKIMGKGLGATVTNLEELREYGRNTGLLTQKLSELEWREALVFMKKHQILDYPGNVRELEDTTPIYLYSTINLYCSSAMIQQLLEEYREGETQDETVQENIYTNVIE